MPSSTCNAVKGHKNQADNSQDCTRFDSTGRKGRRGTGVDYRGCARTEVFLCFYMFARHDSFIA